MHAMRQRTTFLAAATLLALTSVSAISTTLDELAQMGEEAMTAGNYVEAIKHYEKITEIGQTYENLLSVKFDLGWCYYLTSQPDKAIPLFESLSGKRAPSKDVKQQSMFLLAECHARLAGAQPDGAAPRKKALSTAIELHTEFQKEYPKNPNIPQSFYGRAYAYYLDRQMDKAEADLKTVIQQYPATQTAKDATYLLASVYSEQGLDKVKAGERDASKAYIEKARGLFAELSEGKGINLAMANDSIFSLAETWFAAGEYMDAIRYYQQMRSKTEVAGNIKKLQEQFELQFMEELRNRQDTAMTKTAIDKLKVQIRDVAKAPDMMISGYFRIADAFYRLERFDEVRAVCRHLLEDNFTEGEKKQQAYYMIINSYLREKDADAAAREFEGFQEIFGADLPMVDTVDLSIGQLYLARGDVETAAQYFAKNVEEYIDGRNVQDAMYMKFAAEYMEKQYENTLKTISDYLTRFPKGKYVANALYYKAMSLAAQQQWDEALASINEVINQFPKGTEDFTSADEAFYQKGWILNEMKKSPEAITHLETFLERFKTSELRPEAMYQLGIALNAGGDLEKAKAVLQAVPKEFPDHYIAPVALYQIAVMYFEKKEFPQMAEALKALIQAYPANPIVADAYFWLGWIAKEDERYDDAIENLTTCLKSDPANPHAPECMLMIAQSYNSKALKMGLPTVLSEEQRAVYRATVLQAAKAFEDLIVQYPGSTEMLKSVPGIAEDIFDLVRYRQMKEEEAADYFTKAMARHEGDPDVKAQLSYSLGSFRMKNREKDKALAAFKKSLAIKPDVRLSPVMLTEYAEALKEADALAEAETIYNKIIDDYPDAPLALAPAWYGLADIKYRENNFEAAKELFEKVLKEFDWYDQGRQGRVMLAKILERNEKYAEAEKMFEEVWKQETGPTRLGAMLGVARCQLAQAAIARKEGKTLAWKENINVADKNLTKIIVLFEAYPEYVAEALWLKGNAYELVEDKQKARETYSRLILEAEYKNMPWVKLAKERLNALGGILAPASPPTPATASAPAP